MRDIQKKRLKDLSLGGGSKNNDFWYNFLERSSLWDVAEEKLDRQTKIKIKDLVLASIVTVKAWAGFFLYSNKISVFIDDNKWNLKFSNVRAKLQ